MGNFLSYKKLLRLRSSFFIYSILLVVLWLMAFSAAAQTATWIGSGDNDWHNPENWSPNKVPDGNTNVIIGDEMNVNPDAYIYVNINNVANSAVTVYSLTINGGGFLTIGNLVQPITINSDLIIKGGTLNIENTALNVTVMNDVFIYNEGLINHEGPLMVIYGDWTNKGYFTQNRQSIIEVNGDWTHNGSFIANNGTVILTGDSDTVIDGATTFNVLSINKVTADNTVTLINDITTNTLNMDKGKLFTEINKVTLNSNNGRINETEDAYVTGIVETQRTLTMNIPEDFIDSPEDFGGIGITITLKAGSPGLTTVTRTTGTPVGQNQNSILRSFVVTPNGSNTDLDATVEMQYFAHELNDIKEEELTFYVSPDGENWNLQLEGQKTENRMILTGVNTLQHYTLGGINAPLPVELVYFDVTKSGKNAVLKWATAMEQDNKGFALEVSTDGHIFRQFGFVESNSVNSLGIQKYSFIDTENGKTGVRYYRLRQVDNNGTESIYVIKALDFGSIVSTTALAYPNPFSNSLTLAVDAPAAGMARITLHDLVGKQLLMKEQHVQAGASTIPLNVEQVSQSGVYIITLELNSHVRRLKVIKE